MAPRPDMIPLPEVAAEAHETVVGIHRRLTEVSIHVPVRLWDGTTLGPEEPTFRLVLTHPWSLRALALSGTDRAAGESFVRRDVEIEGSLVDALHAIGRVREDLTSGMLRLALARDLLKLPRPPSDRDESLRAARLRGRRHSRDRDGAAVRFHYDLSDDVYGRFLDEQMVYSCAVFAEGDHDDPAEHPEELETAQRRKLDLVCRKLRLQPGDHLLDVGCGWGSLVLHAAQRYDVRATGITLSESQHVRANERIREAGLEDQVEVLLEDYRDIEGTYDAVASVGMFEHVGTNRMQGYFDRMYELTADGGRFLNHAITTGRRGEIRDLGKDKGSFIGTYVFPDGALAPTATAVEMAEASGFEVVDVEQLRPHYALTLRHWLHRFESRLGEIEREVGDEVARTWRLYLAGSVVGFESRDLGVVQTLCSKDAVLPRGRAWMSPEP